LRVGAASSVYAEFGSLVHRVLETVERTATGTGRTHATVDDALEALDAGFDASAFGGAPFADAWRERGRSALSHLYGNWPSRGEAVALEHDLHLTVDGRSWFGRADRIARADGGLTIVDYKTSTSPPPVAEAAESLQLGFYALAASTDDQLDEPVVGAEMWFPAAGGKTVKTRRLDLSRLDAVRDRLRAAADGIDAEDWTPKPGTQCDRCTLRRVCPAWHEGREAFL
jgi:hypothetical protein